MTTVTYEVGALENIVGTEFGPGPWLVVDQERIDTFAEATGDHQWIHVDPERAKQGPFGATVAHGYLTLSLVAPLLEGLVRVEGATMAVNYGLDRVRFPAPVVSGSRLRARAVLASVEPAGAGCRPGRVPGHDRARRGRQAGLRRDGAVPVLPAAIGAS